MRTPLNGQRPESIFVAVPLLLALCFAPRSARAEGWATTQATELTTQATAHAAHGDAEGAIRLFLQAIAIDATFGPAYVGLGAAHEKNGDNAEAERAYATGIEHLVGFADVFLARARLCTKQQRYREAMADLVAASEIAPDNLDLLAELKAADVRMKGLPAALGVTRRMAAVARRQHNEKTASEARMNARALSSLLRELDPVEAGAAGRGAVRQALALFAKR